MTVEKSKLDNARSLRGINFIDPEDGDSTRKPSKKRKEEVGDSNGGGDTLQNVNEESISKVSGDPRRNQRFRQHPKTWHASWRVPFNKSLQLGAQVCFYAPSDEHSRCEKPQRTKNGRNSKSCQRGNCPK